MFRKLLTFASRRPRPLPRDKDGYLISDASFGDLFMVVKTYNTDVEGDEVPYEDWSNQTFHGPFYSEEEAQIWMDESSDDMDVKDWSVAVLNAVR